jgi:hypothetical protein
MFKPGDLMKLRWDAYLWKDITPTGFMSSNNIAFTHQGSPVIITEFTNHDYVQVLHPEHGLRWVEKVNLEILHCE